LSTKLKGCLPSSAARSTDNFKSTWRRREKAKYGAPREYLAHRLAGAAHVYDWDRQQEGAPTATQSAAEYDAIQKSATRLLHALGVGSGADINAMPYGLRHGALGKLAQAEATGLLFGDGLLRQAINGVASLGRWAATARKAEEAAGKLQPRSPVRHAGNVALSQYLKSVVLDGWVEVGGLKIKDNAKLAEFVAAAAEIVGVRLLPDGARQRVRSIFAETFQMRKAVKAQTTELIAP
jgi:hypothetical protein